MKKLLAIILLTALSATIYAQNNKDTLSDKLDEYFLSLTALENFNGNVIVAKNNKIILDKTYNIKNLNDSLAISRESKFIMASVSKVFIKLAILKLVDLKEIKLSDKLSKYVPDFPNGEKIMLE